MPSEKWYINVEHAGLNRARRISGTDKLNVEQRAAELQLRWDKEWTREYNKALANMQTEEATGLLDQLGSLLVSSLRSDDIFSCEEFKDNEPFSLPYPEKPVLLDMPIEPTRPEHEHYPPEPVSSDPFRHPFTVRAREHRRAFELRYKRWKKLKIQIEFDNKKRYEEYDLAFTNWESDTQQAKLANTKLEEDHKLEIAAWERGKVHFLSAQRRANEAIEAREGEYLARIPGAVHDYCDMVLENSAYPDCFPKSWELDYLDGSGMVVVDYTLPSPDDMPMLREVKYVQTRDEFDEKHLTPAQQNKQYDTVLYQVALRTIHELFEADTADAIKAVVFNGWVTAIDRATGKDVTGCLLTIQVSLDEFNDLDLSQVDPKACFKALKGVGSSKLHGLAPVAPLMRIEREDSRFIGSYDVAKNIDTSTNVAAMDWQDFEHLVRELFEKEFSVTGGEVRVTRASRDAGVDAVIFDPDPIRGGKIVVQAKRYTNTVGVDAVRDLYGTTINEGATKGILITTSDYGPDAYAFAKDKPLVLLSGNQLLHLLAKHGHAARIDLKEAKKLLADEKRDRDGASGSDAGLF